MLTHLSFPSQEGSTVLQSLGSVTMYFSDENLAVLTMAGPQFVALTGLYQVHEQDPHFN